MRYRRCLLLAALPLAACGSTSHPLRLTAPTERTELTEPPAGEGCMGPCRPALNLGVAPTEHATVHLTVPDVSEYQPCVSGHVPTVIRLYEAGLNRIDSEAACNAHRLRAWRVWFGGYAFLRPGSCTYEAARTVQLARQVGGLSGPIIADAEVRLPAGFVRCFLDAVRRDAPTSPAIEYTGCYSGLERIQPLWIPSYGAAPACGPWIAWQASDGSYCGESYVTDCSVDNGISSVRVHTYTPKPKPRPKPKPAPKCSRKCHLDRELAVLRRRHHCNRPMRRWRHACKVWSEQLR